MAVAAACHILTGDTPAVVHDELPAGPRVPGGPGLEVAEDGVLRSSTSIFPNLAFKVKRRRSESAGDRVLGEGTPCAAAQ